jgi:hypothetical protein
MRVLALAAAAVLLVSACSSSSSPSPANPGDDAGDAGDGFTHDVVFTMNLQVPASTELHQCQFVQLPAGADINVTAFAHEYTPGSHHFLVYTTDLTAIPPDMTGQYDCTYGNEPIMQHSKGIVYGGQTPSGTFAFPPGVAAKLSAGSVLIMNTHYLNATTGPLDTTVKLGLDTTTPDHVQTEGGFFLFYDPFIDVPAGATASSGGRCPVQADVNVLGAYSHYHYRGTQMQVWNDPSLTQKAPMPFYTSSDWQHPQEFMGPTVWKQGSVVRFQCDYSNTGTDEVFQGPNAKTSEMCVLFGLYYPKQSGPFEGCDNYSVSGFGNQACLSTAMCLQSCPAADAPQYTQTTVIVGSCWERCIAKSCDGAVDTVFPLFDCVSRQCAAECAPGSNSCLGCTTSKCSAEFSACSSQACPK